MVSAARQIVLGPGNELAEREVVGRDRGKRAWKFAKTGKPWRADLAVRGHEVFDRVGSFAIGGAIPPPVIARVVGGEPLPELASGCGQNLRVDDFVEHGWKENEVRADLDAARVAGSRPLYVKDVHDHSGKSPKGEPRATKAVLTQERREFRLQVKLERRCHSGLANVPLLSCGRISKTGGYRYRRASPWYFTTGERGRCQLPRGAAVCFNSLLGGLAPGRSL
jgi:hypothetical protein